MNMKMNIPAVISAPRDAGDSIPNIASTARTCEPTFNSQWQINSQQYSDMNDDM